MNKMLKLMAAGCLAMGTIAYAEPAPGGGSANQNPTAPDKTGGTQGPNAMDRASGRATDATKGAADTARDLNRSARDTLTGAGAMAANAAGDLQAQQQLAAIAQTPEQAADKLFVLMAAAGNSWEIAFSQLVAERSQDQNIKSTAQHIITDHQAANQKLAEVAKQMNVTLPSSLPAMKQQKLAVYRAMPLADLETCYIVESKAAHAKDVTSYSDHTKTVKNEALRGYVTETLPKLQQHAQHIQTAAVAKGLPGQMTVSQGATGAKDATGRTE